MKSKKEHRTVKDSKDLFLWLEWRNKLYAHGISISELELRVHYLYPQNDRNDDRAFSCFLEEEFAELVRDVGLYKIEIDRVHAFG